ncbi:C-C motif chemokine 22 isoform 1-T1 [Trichechus inunguis]
MVAQAYRCLCLLALQTRGSPNIARFHGPYGANVEDSICCRDYIRHPLPLRLVKYFFWTSDSCRRPGVVLLTVKDREICADPRLPWVKKILQKLR